jgi:DNA-binding LytR/AlgR family response regulator
MRVLIIEDEAPAYRRLEKLLEEVEPGIEIIDVIDSVEDAVKWIKNHKEPDVFFMDIQLSDGISFDIFEQVQIQTPVIFTTAFDEYMMKAFKVNSVDYLLKPIKKEDLAFSLNKYKNLASGNPSGNIDIRTILHDIELGRKKYRKRMLIRQSDRLLSIETSDVQCFYIHNGVVFAHTIHNKKHILDGTLDDIYSGLDPEIFFKANRQFVINYNFITSASRYHKGKIIVEMKIPTDDSIIISAERASEFKNWFGN